MYSITVFGLASPIEQTKYPSDHKVFSFQKYFLNILSYKRHEKTVLSCFSFLTIDVTDSFWRIANKKVYVVFVGFHDVYIEVRIVSYWLKYGFNVVIKLTFEYLSPVFDTEDKMAL